MNSNGRQMDMEENKVFAEEDECFLHSACLYPSVRPLRVCARQLLGSSRSDLLRTLAPTSAAHRPRGGETYSGWAEEARDRNG